MQPEGFARVIYDDGTICEGNFTFDGKREGWCISFQGHKKSISIGWYNNDIRHGNFIEFNAEDMKMKACGWYEYSRYWGELDEKNE